MKKNIILISVLLHFISCNTNVGQYKIYRDQISPAKINLKVLGKIRPKSACEIDASYLGVGCEVLCRGYAYYEGYKEYLGNLGVKHARFQSGWAKTEKEPGYFDYTWLDPIIDDCISRGIQPWINISYGNPIYPGGGNPSIRSHIPQGDSALNAWDAYVYDLVNHYKTRVYEWEIWNEPNNHHDRETGPIIYGDLFIRSAEIIRKVQPEGKTIALAIGYYDLKFTEAFFEYLKSKDKVHLVDVASMHGYPQNPDDDRLDRFIELVKKYNPKITFLQGEAGAPSKKTTGALANVKIDFTELTQAKWDLRRSLVHIGRGIPHSQFAISDMKYPNWEIRGVNAKGLLKINENDKNIERPKQSYFAYQYLTSMFDNTVIAIDKTKIELLTDSASTHYSFNDIINDKPVITYWLSGDIPNNNISTEQIKIKCQNIDFNSPLLIDIRTGYVYKIPKNSIKNIEGVTEFTLPVYDSPLLICDKDFLSCRKLL